MAEKMNKRKNFTNYLIAFLSIMAVNPFYTFYVTEFLLGTLVMLLFVAASRKIKVFDAKIFWLIAFIYALIVVQGLVFNGFSLAAVYLPIVIFYVPYLIYKIIGISYFKYFVNVLFVIALYTTPLWLAQSIFSPFDSYLQDLIEKSFSWGLSASPRSLLLFTPAWDDYMFSEKYGVYRNSGLFHEPGAYGVFLNIGILMNTFITGKMFDKKNKVFIFCLLTTFSTAGYITFFILFAFFLLRAKLNPVLKTLVVLAFLFISYNTYQEEEFLQSKVESQFESQSDAAQYNLGAYTAQSGRFFAFFTSLDLFLKNPFTGRGIIYATSEKASGEMHEEASYTYGFIGLLATYGAFFGLLYLLNIYKGLKHIASISAQSKLNIAAGFIALNLALLTQVFVLSTPVVVIFMAGLYFVKQKVELNPPKTHLK
jgi:hypothetical protein